MILKYVIILSVPFVYFIIHLIFDWLLFENDPLKKHNSVI